MGILGLLFRGAREVVQEQSAKRDLERKLGRKVSTDELYSLGSHLDAAQPTAPQMPLISTPRESGVPFGDAKPPMKTLTKLLLIGLPLLFFGGVGAVALVAIMPEHQYNRLNPFTPKPPAGTFPARLGAFSLKQSPDWHSVQSYNPVEYWDADYTNGSNYITSKLWDCKSDAELNAAFEKQKKYLTPSGKYKITDDSATRFALVTYPGMSTYVLFKDGLRLRQVGGSTQQPVLEVEGLLKNAPPVEMTPINVSEMEASNPTGGNLSVTVLQLLDDYKKDAAAADRKYKGKTITVTGTVEVADKDKTGKPMIGFMRPGATAPKDGMVVCSFEKSQEANLSKVKKGDLVMLKGRVFGNVVFSVMLENCAKL
jgi:hypothetical protein